MDEGFDEWNDLKKSLNTAINFPRPKRRQIWWCAIGLNIGSEQSCEEGFERPVLVVKVFGSILFWGLPITSSDPDGRKATNHLFYRIDGIPYVSNTGVIKHLQGYVALHQLRAYDSRRLKRKILRMDAELFSQIEGKVRELL